MRNCGIILPDMQISQLSYEIITQINSEIISGSPYDYRIFFENISTQCVQPLCAVMNISEIWAYSGILISTTLENTLFSINLKTDCLKFFYLWDLEWLRNKKNYLYNLSILRNPQIKLIVRSKDCAKELERYSNKQANFITDRLSFKTLADHIYEQNSSTQQ